jgi:3-dehydroquinate synthase
VSSEQRVRVGLGDRSYDIWIGPGLLPRLGELAAEAVPAGRLFVVAHPRLERLHGAALLASLEPRLGGVLHVPAGERFKTLHRAERLYDELLALGADRTSVIVAFGGGVIGDLAGFVAATYMRGLAFIQVPTTLLAQVDASVGGKVAVDHPKAKNLVGAFHQPRLVVADTEVLRTLSGRDYRAGLAEVVKHGAIADADLFAWIESSQQVLERRDPEAVAHAVRRSCEIKADVVARDERESGLRAILNFGHTVGHALESLTGYTTLRHGEAVAIGMAAAARLSERLGLCEPGIAARLEAVLAGLRLPIRIAGLRADDIIAAARSDKKAVGGALRLVLLRRLGEVEVVAGAPEEEIRRVLISLGAVE